MIHLHIARAVKVVPSKNINLLETVSPWCPGIVTSPIEKGFCVADFQPSQNDSEIASNSDVGHESIISFLVPYV